MGQTIGGNIRLYLGHKDGKVKIVDDSMPLEVRDAGIGNGEWEVFIRKANETIGGPGGLKGPWCFLLGYICFVVIVPHGLVYGALFSGLHEMIPAFWLFFSLFVTIIAIAPIMVNANAKKKNDERISALLQTDCDYSTK